MAGSNELRRAVLLADGMRLADSMMLRNRASRKVTPRICKARQDYFQHLLRPGAGKKLAFRGEVIWYTPPDSQDGLDVEQGRLLYILRGLARVKAVTGALRDVPVGNLEEKWKEKLRKLGLQVPDSIKSQ